MIAILANGTAPHHPIPRQILAEAALLVCCDGAFAAARALGREPDFVVGDGDSLSPADRAALGDRFVHVAEQDTNDLAKAFRFVRPRASRIAILGATGLREDHMLGNVFRLVDFTAAVPDTVLYSDFGTFEVVRGERMFAAQTGDAVSVFAPVPGTKVASIGLEWPLGGVGGDGGGGYAAGSGSRSTRSGSAKKTGTKTPSPKEQAKLAAGQTGKSR